MQGTPQEPDPNELGLHIPIRIRLEPPVEVMMPGPEREEEAPKRPYLKKYHFEEHGYDESCEGCVRLSADMPARPHLEACRKGCTKNLERRRKKRSGWKQKREDR